MALMEIHELLLSALLKLLIHVFEETSKFLIILIDTYLLGMTYWYSVERTLLRIKGTEM